MNQHIVRYFLIHLFYLFPIDCALWKSIKCIENFSPIQKEIKTSNNSRSLDIYVCWVFDIHFSRLARSSSRLRCWANKARMGKSGRKRDGARRFCRSQEQKQRNWKKEKMPSCVQARIIRNRRKNSAAYGSTADREPVREKIEANQNWKHISSHF